MVLRHGVMRTWRNPGNRRAILPLRAAFASPRGLVAVGMVTFVLWWFLVAAIPVSIVEDWRYRPDSEDES